MADYSKIEHFLKQYFENHGVIAEGDDAKLEQFMKELGSYVDELSLVPDNGGDKLILYSGKYGENMWRYADAASQSGQGHYYISNTEAGRVLNHDDVLINIDKICGGNKNLIARIKGDPIDGKVRNRFTVGNELSLGDRVSANLAKNAKGDVTIWAPTGETGKVLSDTELRMVLTNENITSINGVPKSKFLEHYKQEINNPHYVFDDPSALEQKAVDSVFEQVKQSAPKEYFNEAIVHYDSDAKISGIDMTKVIGGDFKIKPEDSEFSASTLDLHRHASDTVVRERFGQKDGKYLFDDLSQVDQMKAKQIELCVRDVSELKYMDVTDDILGRYLVASHKTIDQLDNMDNICLSIAYKIGNKSDDITKLLKTVKKYDKVAKIVKSTVNIVEVVGDLAHAGYVAYQIYQSYEEGNYTKSIGILAAASVELAIGNLGGALLTEAIAPYFVMIGAAVGGPVGGLIGGFLAGAIAYGFAGYLGNLFYDNALQMYEDSTKLRYSVDPLVLDLFGNGFNPTTVQDGTHFDLDQNGFAEKMGWVRGDDHFLAIDKNGDRIINDGSELFGDKTMLKNGQFAKNGFEALREYDSNQDGLIDEKDKDFSSLLLWNDRNGNGFSEDGELISLKEAGIASISLEYKNLGEKTESGTTIGNVAKFKKSDGSEYQIAEYWVENESHNTKDLNQIEISQEILGLANIKERGTVPSLHKAMMLDKTGDLKRWWIQFENSTNVDERWMLIEKILGLMTNTKDVQEGSRGANIDAKKLHIIESLLGKKFVGIWGKDPNPTAANELAKIYNRLINAYYIEATSKTTLKDILPLVRITEKNGQKSADLSILKVFLPKLLGENAVVILGDLGRFFANLEKNNVKGFDEFKNHFGKGSKDHYQWIMNGAEQAVVGTEKDDTLSASSEKPYLFGREGNDVLKGSNKNDFLYGGLDNDTLYGFRVIIMTVANSLRKSRVSDSLPKVETRRFKSLSIA